MKTTSVRAISLVVIGGYLGAGKTTLLNYVLTQAGSRRVTVLVNDFGSINIDAALIRERTDDVISLENGCVCCSIGGRLTEALLAISSRDDPPDLLIIEASGVSDPLRIAQIGMLDRAFRLDGIVVLVDAERVRETLADPYVGDIAQRQLESATALVLNKTDLLDDAARRAVVETIETLARSRVMVETSHGVVPSGLIFDLPEREGEDARQVRRDVARPLGSSPTPFALCSVSFVTDAVFSRRKLKDALQSFSAKLLRAKGFVRLDGDGALHELHVAGSRVRITACANAGSSAGSSASSPASSSESMIVLIGLFDNDEEARVRAALTAAQRDA